MITGMGVMSSLGNGVDELFDALKNNKSAVRQMPEWDVLVGLRTKVGAPAKDYDSKSIPRSVRRSMSKMSEMALLAAKEALGQSGIKDINGSRSLICLGSTTGSPETIESSFRKYIERQGPGGQLSTSFFKVMNHSVAANVSVGLEYYGPQLAISSACSSSTHAVVCAWEMIQSGLYDVVIAGGADELHHTSAAVFDNVHAASTKYNDQPDLSPRPFDVERDGLVVSEGAGVLVVESEEHAKNRGADVLAYVDGGAYFCDGKHMSQPDIEGMSAAIKLALQRSQREARDVDYVCAHGTATLMGDVKEARATAEVFGTTAPVSSLKGHLGHSMAACGAIEIASCIKMMQHNTLIPTRNLEKIDPEASVINLLTKTESTKVDVVMSNNFAFGGMNASVVLSTP